MSETTAYPAEVTKAICQVMGKVKKLGKNDRNGFDKYMFAGIDKFIEAVNPLCADAGLIIFTDEVGREIKSTEKNGKQTVWLIADYEITLAHESGAVIEKPFRRSVMVPANGAQAFGSAQSYALKQFMRAQFMIPTGEKDDADFREATELPDNQPAKKKTSAYQARKDGDYPKLEAEIRNCSTPDELREWGLANKDRTDALPEHWQEHLREEYKRQMGELEMRHFQRPLDEAAE